MKGILAFITGASAGIGEATARRFAAEGADLVLWARREKRLDALAGELRLGGATVHTRAVDVRDREAVIDAADALLADIGTPDILLNNAGLASGLSFVHEGDHEDWDRMIDTNLKGLLNVTRAILPAMVERGTGHVINIGSTAGHQVYPMGNVYNATKFGVKALTEGMNLDVAGTGVRVSSVDPGFVETEFSVVRFHGDEERASRVYDGLQPLTGADIADTVRWVASQPPHVQVAEVIVLPAAQASTTLFHRE